MPISVHEKINERINEIVRVYNKNAKKGIGIIDAICKDNNLNLEEQVAHFFLHERKNLNLEDMGDFLGSEANGNVLKAFMAGMNFEGQDILPSLRQFLKTFKLPGEGQKIGRLIEGFSKAYYNQNPNKGMANQDAVLLLSYQIIMLNTDLHNVGVKNKMTIDSLTNILRGTNDGNDFDREFLTKIYNEIKTNPLEYNFVKHNPGYELTTNLGKDKTYVTLCSLMKSGVDANKIFSGLHENLKVEVDKPRAWYHRFIGYSGTMTIKDESTGASASIQVYKSGWLTSKTASNTKIIIQPGSHEDPHNITSVQLAAKLAAQFEVQPSHIKGTYDYELNDLKKAYDHEKLTQNQSTVKSAQQFKENVPKATASSKVEIEVERTRGMNSKT